MWSWYCTLCLHNILRDRVTRHAYSILNQCRFDMVAGDVFVHTSRIDIIEIYAIAIHLVFSFARFIASPSVIKRWQNVSSIYCCTWISWIHMDKQICILASSFHFHFALSCGAAAFRSPWHCDALHVLCVGWYLSQIKSPDKMLRTLRVVLLVALPLQNYRIACNSLLLNK